MTHANRSKIQARRWLIPAVDGLEARALLNGTMVIQHALVPAHVEVSTKAVKAEKPAHANVHAPKPAHPATEHASAKAKANTKASKLPSAKIHDDLVYAHVTAKKTTIRGQVIFAPIAGAYGPTQLEMGYGVNLLGSANQGQNQTIGIVDEYNDPTIIADANAFSSFYGLPTFNITGGPTLTVAKDTTFGTVSTSPVGPNGTTEETALDVEWAHAMAPKANIVLVEVPAVFSFSALLHGIVYATNSGASVVSLSYGGRETGVGLPALYSLNQAYLANGPASTVAVTVSTGDTSFPSFPASTPSVIGVGGTALHLTGSNAYSFETAWGGVANDGAGGGGTTAFYTTPSFQASAGITYNGHRALPDVALEADPLTGVSVYNSYNEPTNGGDPWNEVGGTSLASPLFAGMLSIVQQDRIAAGKAILTSVQINNDLYAAYSSPSLYSTLFHDVTQGNNGDSTDGFTGYSAGNGYDLATGIGSPIANTLIPYLVSLS